MNGEVECSQADVDLKALEGFLAGNRALERLDAHHLLRLRGSPTRARRRSGSSCQTPPGSSLANFILDVRD